MIITDNLGKSQKPSTSEQGLQTIPMNKNQHPDYPENSFMYEVHHLTDYTTWQNHSLKPPYQNRGKQNSGHTKWGWGKQQIVNTPTNTLLRQTTKPARLTLSCRKKHPHWKGSYQQKHWQKSMLPSKITQGCLRLSLLSEPIPDVSEHPRTDEKAEKQKTELKCSFLEGKQKLYCLPLASSCHATAALNVSSPTTTYVEFYGICCCFPVY